MGDAVGLVLGLNGGVRPAVEGEGEEKIDLPGVGLSRTGFVGSVCGSLPPGRRPLRVRGRERGRGQAMNNMWDDPEMVKCLSCNREFDRNNYQSYTCMNCESGVVERVDE
jgi:hypothetical protein